MISSGSFRSGRRIAAVTCSVKGRSATGLAAGCPRLRRALDSARPDSFSGGMNDPEEIMLHALPGHGLIAQRKALEAAGTALALVERVPGPLKSLADQVIRSASSVPANLAEGHGRIGRDRAHFWRIAYGSAKEVDSHLRLLFHAGAIDAAGASAALRLFDEVRAMTWRLLHPRV